MFTRPSEDTFCRDHSRRTFWKEPLSHPLRMWQVFTSESTLHPPLLYFREADYCSCGFRAGEQPWRREGGFLPFPLVVPSLLLRILFPNSAKLQSSPAFIYCTALLWPSVLGMGWGQWLSLGPFNSGAKLLSLLFNFQECWTGSWILKCLLVGSGSSALALLPVKCVWIWIQMWASGGGSKIRDRGRAPVLWI